MNVNINIGSTPTNTFIVPSNIDITGYKEIQIVYNQDDRPIITKSNLNDDVIVSGHNLITTLSQADTFKLNYNKQVRIQARIMLADDNVIASKHINVSVLECLDGRILGSE